LARFPSFSLGGREKTILQEVEEHLAVVRQCVVAYQKMVVDCAAGGLSAHKAFADVQALEANASALQRALNAKIAEGAFFGGVREDILNLIQSDDNIADSAKDAARLLVIGSDGDEAFPGLLKSEHMTAFQAQQLAAVDALALLIQALQTDKATALSKVKAVEDCEEAADDEKEHLLIQLFSRPRTADPVSIIQLRDFIFASDNIADDAEKASDVVLVLVAKGYG
jgi:predicted phosphate transport protein (TIGR00153 family)